MSDLGFWPSMSVGFGIAEKHYKDVIAEKDVELAAARKEIADLRLEVTRLQVYERIAIEAVEAVQPLQVGGDLHGRIGVPLGRSLTSTGVAMLCEALREADREITALREAVRWYQRGN